MILFVGLNSQYVHTALSLRQIGRTLPYEDVRFLEGHVNQPVGAITRAVLRLHPRVVCFSCYIWNINTVLSVAGRVKAAYPDARVYLGGPEAEYDVEACLEHPFIDGVVCGEAEAVWPGIYLALKADAGAACAPGLCTRGNPNPPPLSEMVARSWPDPYPEGEPLPENRILYMETSRGCPYRCAYCLSSARRGVRMLEEKEAVRRLLSLSRRGAGLIKLVDRTFNCDGERANAIFSALIEDALKNGVRTTYHFEMCANLIDQSCLDVLKKAPPGLFQFEVGVQSTDDQVLSAIRRSPDWQGVRDGARQVIALSNIPVHMDLIVGLPGEDMDKFARSFNQVYALGPDRVQVGFLKLLRGSLLRRRAAELGIAYSPFAPYEVLKTDALSTDDILQLHDFERTLDLYIASGCFGAGVRLMLWKERPFQAVFGFSKWLRERGGLEAEQSIKTRAGLLREYLHRRYPKGWVDGLIAHDLHCAGRMRDVPEALRREMTKAEREAARALFSPLRGQYVRTYPVHPLKFAREGILRVQKTAVAYDPGAGRAFAL